MTERDHPGTTTDNGSCTASGKEKIFVWYAFLSTSHRKTVLWDTYDSIPWMEATACWIYGDWIKSPSETSSLMTNHEYFSWRTLSLEISTSILLRTLFNLEIFSLNKPKE